MSERHAGKVAVVTGGSSGIGQAIVCRLAKEGARIAIADIGDTTETVDLVRHAGGEAFGIRCDISDSKQVVAFFEEVRRRVGPPLILVHSAAHMFTRSFDDVSAEDWRKVQAVNQDSMFHMLRAVLPGMKAAAWGRIIVIVSSTFFCGTEMLSHYVTSKGALIGLVRGLAGELGSCGITMNAVAPGLTPTKTSLASIPPETFQQMISVQAVKRMGTPEDQAAAVSFLASDDAGFITGQTLLVDGGAGRH
jgi:NAD(P)-dependent dehydrogenase (short-subunit alcohol dehydrogenase family)